MNHPKNDSVSETWLSQWNKFIKADPEDLEKFTGPLSVSWDDQMINLQKRRELERGIMSAFDNVNKENSNAN